jgi:hypothetical protein
MNDDTEADARTICVFDIDPGAEWNACSGVATWLAYPHRGLAMAPRSTW